MSAALINKANLDNEFGQVKSTTLGKDLKGIQISHQNCNAVVSLYAGHVLSWQPKGEKAVFWLSDSTEYQKGKAIRGGIPLCWPWFGPHPHDKDLNNELPKHGFARTAQWQLQSLEINQHDVTLVLTLQGKNELPIFPYTYELIQTLSFGKEFSQTLAIKNNSDQPFEFTGALHSYFKISHPENVKVDGLSDLFFDDKLTGKSEVKQDLINCLGPVDRVYHQKKPTDNKMIIIDQQWLRAIEVTSTNAPQWVFWNPGELVADSMADIHANGEQEYVCLEAASTIPQLIPANGSSTMSQVIAIKPIAK